MATHLPEPVGEPDAGAAEIIAAIETYRDSDRSPVAIAAGLRHVYHHAEIGWNAAVAKAKSVSTYREIMDATGDKLGTLQGRIRQHKRRERGA